MNKSEMETLCRISTLMSCCPNASPNPYDIVGYIHASRDFSNIVRLSANALSSFALFRYFSAQTAEIKSRNLDPETIKYYKDNYEETLNKLESFILKRQIENWE